MSDDTTMARSPDTDDLTPDAVPTAAVALLAPPVVDAQQNRVMSIAKVLDTAYQRASLLELADSESKALRDAFPDDAVRGGANGKPGLLYIEHASIRERLHDVIGPGRWALVMRRMWSEDYTTSKGGAAVRVYAECVLLVRGCFVGESIGAMSYYPNNAEQNYSDAVEGAQSEALRRIAARFLGVGLQVWKKSFCEGWWARHPNGKAPAPDLAEPEPGATLTDAESEAVFAALADKVGVDGKVPEAEQVGFLRFVSQVCKSPITHLSEVPQSRMAEIMHAIRTWTPRPGSPADLRKKGSAQ